MNAGFPPGSCTSSRSALREVVSRGGGSLDGHWSQAELADELGVSRQTVNALETGKYDPSLPLAFKIARLFDRLIEDIFDPEDEAEATKRRA